MLGLALVPQMWVRRVIAEHGQERHNLPGTGAEMERSLLDRMGLTEVKVERTDLGNHYDPEAKAVRLLDQHYDGRSLSAIVIAAHEVGHVLQDATGYKPLAARQRLVRKAIPGTAELHRDRATDRRRRKRCSPWDGTPIVRRSS